MEEVGNNAHTSTHHETTSYYVNNVLISAFTILHLVTMEVFHVLRFCRFAFTYFVAISWSSIAKPYALNSEDISLFLAHDFDAL